MILHADPDTQLTAVTLSLATGGTPPTPHEVRFLALACADAGDAALLARLEGFLQTRDANDVLMLVEVRGDQAWQARTAPVHPALTPVIGPLLAGLGGDARHTLRYPLTPELARATPLTAAWLLAHTGHGQGQDDDGPLAFALEGGHLSDADVNTLARAALDAMAPERPGTRWGELLGHPALREDLRHAAIATVTAGGTVPWTLEPLLGRPDLTLDEVRALATCAWSRWHVFAPQPGLVETLAGVTRERGVWAPLELLRRPDVDEAAGVALIHGDAPFGRGREPREASELAHAELRDDAPDSWVDLAEAAEARIVWPDDDDGRDPPGTW